MTWSMDLEHAEAIADRVVAALRDRRVPITPQTFQIWYAHVTGSNPALSRLVRLLESSSDSFSETRCDELYERFFAGQDQARSLVSSTRKLEALVDRVGGHMVDTSSSTADFGDMLSSTSIALTEATERHHLIELVSKLQERTDYMQSQASSLKVELDRSGQEIEALRSDLASVRRAAYTDQLTGVGNRKLFDETIRQEVTVSAEGGTTLALLVADIDFFKKFNDEHGHQVGDVVLRLVAARLRAAVKGRDTVARYGGEEFAIILPRTELEDARQLAEQLRHEIATSRIVLRKANRDLGVITISIGVSAYSPGESVQSFFERADQALYRAKRQGRNQVVVDEQAGLVSVAAE